MTTMKKCRVCGCQDLTACWDDEMMVPCHWVADDLCSVCARGVQEKQGEQIGRQVGLLMNAIERCLQQKLRPVLVVVESLEHPGSFSVISSVSAESTRELLEGLAENVMKMEPEEETAHIQAPIVIGHGLIDQGPGHGRQN